MILSRPGARRHRDLFDRSCDGADRGFRRFMSAIRPGFILGLILLGALALRVEYLSEIRRLPWFDTPLLDASFHDYWARGIVNGNWTPPAEYPDPQIRALPYYKAPGYPWFLAAVYAVLGGDYLAPRLVQMGLGMVNILLLYLLGRRWLGQAVGLVAATLMAVYWMAIYFEGELHEATLLIFLTLLLLFSLDACVRRLSWGRCVVLGAILGFTALVRPNALLCAPAVALALVWTEFRTPCRRWIIPLACIAIGLAAAIAPVAIRNARVSGEFIPITSFGGFNLYLGNNDEATGTSSVVPGLNRITGGATWAPFHYPEINKAVDLRIGRRMSPTEASRYWTGQAFDFVRRQPWRWAKLTFKKAVLVVSPAEIGDQTDLHTARRNSGVLGGLPGDFGVLLAVALVGAAFLLWPVGNRLLWSPQSLENRSVVVRRFALFAGIVVVAHAMSIVPFIVFSRYRCGMLPGVMLFAAAGLCGVVHQLRERRFAGAMAAVCLGAALFFSLRLTARGYPAFPAAWHENLAFAYEQRGQTELAMREFARVIALDPLSLSGHSHLGAILYKQGQVAEAKQHFESAIRLNPENPKSQNNLACALMSEGRMAEAKTHFREAIRLLPDYADAHANYGLLLFREGGTAEAVSVLERAVRLDPLKPSARHYLGCALASQGKADAARQHLMAAVALAPMATEARCNLATHLLGMGRKAEAEEHLRRVIELEPANVRALNTLGTLLVSEDRSREARPCLERAARIAPGSPEIRNNLGAAYAGLGQTNAAIGEFVEALRLDPAHSNAASNLRKVQGKPFSLTPIPP